MVSQPDLELQLKVWKELAISKQVLMRAATDALKLDPNVNQDDLKAALEAVMKKTAKAETDLAFAQQQSKNAIAALERKVTLTEQNLAAAQATNAELLQTQERAQQQMATDRATAAKDLQKVKDRLAEQEKALKAVNTALADTPENVLKKMNLLKKQKQDEATARQQIEASFTAMRAEKTKQEQAVRDCNKLVTQFRDLHANAIKLRDQLKPLLEDKNSIPLIADLDTKLLDAIEKATASAAKK